jgi:hypothetical protein
LVRIKTIRTKNTVLDKSKRQFGVVFIDDRRLCTDGFSSVHKRRSARTGRRPRKTWRHSSKDGPMFARVGERTLRAPRANPVFGTDKNPSVPKTRFWIKTRAAGLALLLCAIVDYARMVFT